MIRRAAFAPLFVVALLVGVTAACNEGGGVASPSNTPHGSRCLMDTDCMGGYECSKGKGDILGECVPKTMGVGSSGGTGTSGGGAKPAGSATGPTASAKPADPPKGGSHSQTPEPLPPPKPPKDPKPATDSTFSP